MNSANVFHTVVNNVTEAVKKGPVDAARRREILQSLFLPSKAAEAATCKPCSDDTVATNKGIFLLMELKFFM